MSNSEQNNNSDWKEREIGALWKKRARIRSIWWKMKVGGEEVGVVIFTNRYKEEGSKQPDFRVYLERKREDEEAVTATAAQTSQEDDLL